MCDYAVKLTKAPSCVGLADADELRRHGWDDTAIHDAIQVISYFNYINRVAEGVGVEDEPEWEERGTSSHGTTAATPATG